MSRIFGEVRQNGYVVHDIEAAMKHWTEALGVGPFFYLERAPIKDFRYYGEPSDLEVSIALFKDRASPRLPGTEWVARRFGRRKD